MWVCQVSARRQVSACRRVCEAAVGRIPMIRRGINERLCLLVKHRLPSTGAPDQGLPCSERHTPHKWPFVCCVVSIGDAGHLRREEACNSCVHCKSLPSFKLAVLCVSHGWCGLSFFLAFTSQLFDCNLNGAQYWVCHKSEVLEQRVAVLKEQPSHPS